MAQSPEHFLLIKADRLIDAVGDKPLDKGAVLIEGTTIVAAGRQSEVVPPEGAQVRVLEYPGMTVMPGMVDCHTHQIGFGDGRAGEDVAELPDEVLALQAARNARSSLFTGVTTIRENGPKNETMFRLRDAVNAGMTIGPRMVLCGRPIAIIGGHMGYFGTTATGPTEARAAARQLIKEGADYIKITATGGTTRTSFPLLPSFNVDELLAITDEARKFGKLTATHSSSSQGIANSLDAGVDMIIHCIFKEPDGETVFREDIAERIGESGAYVNPTIHVTRSGIWSLLHKKQSVGITSAEQAHLDDLYRELDTRLENNSRLIELGLRVITGSDSSWGDYSLGNTVYETECLVMAGMSNLNAIKSVTSAAAAALGVDHAVGTLESGKDADILVVEGDPTHDINDLWNVRHVFKSGQRVDRGSDDSLASVHQTPPPTTA